ncbi:hypothetical protein [Methylotuvimicrobium sp. KM2]|uniref:hypothetical protein n=1 Tax=Methylotuvimicrobium sp. KM2 TaxID=3133976 RepID=UPI0031019705
MTREQFSYTPEQNTYRCPQGKLLTASGKAHQKNGKWLTSYKNKAADCSQRPYANSV